MFSSCDCKNLTEGFNHRRGGGGGGGGGVRVRGWERGRTLGARCTLSVSSTMMPRVPSLPTNNWVKSYPVALFRTRRRVRISLPSGVTTWSDTTFSAVVPYMTVESPDPRVLAIPPTLMTT
jgi:hypothetical protein